MKAPTKKNKSKGKHYSVIIEQDSAGYYVGTVPELRGCHSQAKSIDTLLVRIKEAILLCLDVETNKQEETEFIGFQRIAVTG